MKKEPRIQDALKILRMGIGINVVSYKIKHEQSAASNH